MFVQIIHGKLADADLFERQTDQWQQDLKPGAQGYLGSTRGVTPDGRGVLIGRFESQEAAESNSGRPEQGAWWNEMAKAFDGEPTFRNCVEVDSFFGGGSDEAGFVQVIETHAKDQAAMRSRSAEMEAQLREIRSDILGMLVGWHGDGGGVTQVVYFTSEADARSGETSPGSEERGKEYMDMFDQPPVFFDLVSPKFD